MHGGWRAGGGQHDTMLCPACGLYLHSLSISITPSMPASLMDTPAWRPTRSQVVSACAAKGIKPGVFCLGQTRAQQLVKQVRAWGGGVWRGAAG